jgi:hypothetical protein
VVAHWRSRAQEISSVKKVELLTELGGGPRERLSIYDITSFGDFLKNIPDEVLKKGNGDWQSGNAISNLTGLISPVSPHSGLSSKPQSESFETSRKAKRHSMLLLSPPTSPPGAEI